MTRTEFLVWILIIASIFWIYSTGRHHLAFGFMSLYAILGGVLYKAETELTKKAMKLIELLNRDLYEKRKNAD